MVAGNGSVQFAVTVRSTPVPLKKTNFVPLKLVGDALTVVLFYV